MTVDTRRYTPRGVNDLVASFEVVGIGRLPKSWKTRSMRYSVRIAEGQVNPEHEAFRDLPLIAPNHIESRTGRLLGFTSAAEQAAESGKYYFQTGTVLYSKIRPELVKACVAPCDGLCSADMYPLVPASDLDPRYLLFFLISDAFTEQVRLASMRVAMPKVNRHEFGNCVLSLPPLDEQRAIAAFLDRETAQIDELIAKKERLLELLNEKMDSLINAAVLRGMDPSAELRDSGLGWLGDIPAHWTVFAYKRACNRVDVGIAEAATHAYCDDGVPIVRSTNVKPNRLDVTDVLQIETWFAEKNRSKTLRTGDLVTVRTGYPGTTAVIPAELDGTVLHVSSFDTEA